VPTTPANSAPGIRPALAVYRKEHEVKTYLTEVPVAHDPGTGLGYGWPSNGDQQIYVKHYWYDCRGRKARPAGEMSMQTLRLAALEAVHNDHMTPGEAIEHARDLLEAAAAKLAVQP
jgi:hypothetical protein